MTYMSIYVEQRQEQAGEAPGSHSTKNTKDLIAVCKTIVRIKSAASWRQLSMIHLFMSSHDAVRHTRLHFTPQQSLVPLKQVTLHASVSQTVIISTC